MAGRKMGYEAAQTCWFFGFSPSDSSIDKGRKHSSWVYDMAGRKVGYEAAQTSFFLFGFSPSDSSIDKGKKTLFLGLRHGRPQSGLRSCTD